MRPVLAVNAGPTCVVAGSVLKCWRYREAGTSTSQTWTPAEIGSGRFIGAGVIGGDVSIGQPRAPSIAP